MLIGQFESVLDEKKRSALPKRFRDELGATVIITKGLDTQLIVVAERDWETLLEGTLDKPFIQKSVRELQRYLLGNAHYSETDTKGRIILPEYLKKYAQIDKEIVYVGIGRFVEIWDKKMWYDHQMKMTENGMISQIADTLTGDGNE
jgi:MraZ protein